jgi:hypothetical protein
MEKSRLVVAYSHFFGRFSSGCTFAKLAKYELSKVQVLGSSHYFVQLMYVLSTHYKNKFMNLILCHFWLHTYTPAVRRESTSRSTAACSGPDPAA